MYLIKFFSFWFSICPNCPNLSFYLKNGQSGQSGQITNRKKNESTPLCFGGFWKGAMATLIAAYNSSGCIGRCDAKCYNATEPECTCICGGLNHGAGQSKAIENTNELAESWMQEYEKQHQVDKWHLPSLQRQLPGFEEQTT